MANTRNRQVDVPCILAIDCGSTSFKAALFSRNLDRMGEYSLKVPYIRNDGTFCEMDPIAVRKVTEDLVRGISETTGIHADKAGKIAITSQAQTFTIVDANGKTPIPLISWIDTRAKAESEELVERIGQDFHTHCSFPNPIPQLTLTKLLWCKKHKPDVLNPANRILTLPSFVGRSFAESTHAIDRNIGAMGGLYSLREGGWRGDATSICGVERNMLEELVDTGQGLAMPDGREIVFAGNDQTAGAWGNGCTADTVVVTLGTALVAYRYAGEEPGPYSEECCWGPYPGGGYYELATRDEGCLALDWARDEIMPDQNIKDFDRAARKTIPRVDEQSGFFFPNRMRTADAWKGRFEKPDQNAYAVLEGISFSLKQLLFEEMRCARNTRFKAIGGGSQSDLWMQMTADVLGSPVTRGNGDSLLGAAMMAIGRRVDLRDGGCFQPNQKRQNLFERRYDRWRKLATEGG
ncbi:MAG: FGGY family carbohydrate kinase [Candidatus Brocadiia bacterium]